MRMDWPMKVAVTVLGAMVGQGYSLGRAGSIGVRPWKRRRWLSWGLVSNEPLVVYNHGPRSRSV